jgi:hypothetical protein
MGLEEVKRTLESVYYVDVWEVSVSHPTSMHIELTVVANLLEVVLRVLDIRGACLKAI